MTAARADGLAGEITGDGFGSTRQGHGGRRPAGRRRAAIAVAGAVIAAMTLSACETPPDNSTIGAGAGGVGGALIGSAIGAGTGKVIAIIAGGVLGAIAGGVIGQQLDERDKQRAEAATAEALENTPTGQPTVWVDPETGERFEVTPGRPFYRDASRTQVCRDVTYYTTINGRVETARGVGCREDDGTWRVVESS